MRVFKQKLLNQPIIRYVWSCYREAQLNRIYLQHRERYSRVAQSRGIICCDSEIITSIRSRIRGRNYIPIPRCLGGIHTFAFIPQYSWHKHLLPDLQSLGPVSLFDYVSLGYSPNDFGGNSKWNKVRIDRRQEMLDKVLPAFRNVHEKNPVDWVFCYAGGQNMSPSVIRQITEEYGTPTVNMTLDDKHGWAGSIAGDACTGARDITSAFDLYMTSSRVSCEWHLVEGGRPSYSPEGFDSSYYCPRETKKDIAVSFVGASYGFRRSVILYLDKHGVHVETFGAGWPNGYVTDPADIFNRSIINLGMGGIGYSEQLTNVKGRDFEIPGTGGGVYLTSFNPDLAQHFHIGQEILCYRNRDEMLELIRYYLAHPDEAAEIARRGRVRCLREHRWLHRYEKMLDILQIL